MINTSLVQIYTDKYKNLELEIEWYLEFAQRCSLLELFLLFWNNEKTSNSTYKFVPSPE